MKITRWISSIFVKKLPEVKLSIKDKRNIILKRIKRVPQWKVAQEYGITEDQVYAIVNNSKLYDTHKEKRRKSDRKARKKKRINQI